MHAATASPSPGHPIRPDGKACLLCFYAAEEIARKERVVEMDESGWVAVVPFWAVWPFEMLRAFTPHCSYYVDLTGGLVLPYKRHIPSLLQMTPEEDGGLARILRKVLVRYDNLFSCVSPFPLGTPILKGVCRCPFPYSMGLHQSPLPPTDPENDIAHVHFHFYPPLLRSASVRKFLVGFEMMGEVQVGRMVSLRGSTELMG